MSHVARYENIGAAVETPAVIVAAAMLAAAVVVDDMDPRVQEEMDDGAHEHGEKFVEAHQHGHLVDSRHCFAWCRSRPR